jgi:TPR repeat protein
MIHLSGCSAVSCHLTVYTKFRTPSFQKAAEQHFPIAQAELAWLYRTGEGTTQDLPRARDLLEKASKARYRRAEMDLLEMNIFSKPAR